MSHQFSHIQKLLEGRYYLRDENGNLLETEPDAMFSRVAGAIAKVENTNWQSWADKFYLLMRDNKFLPNTPTLINAGKKQGVYAACNVLEIPDSMNGIFDILKDAAIISKYGGGLGLYFGNLREEGAIVKSTGQTSSGPVSFMEVFDAMCNTVKQGGSRRGAMLAGLPVWHPDIRKFISCKDDGKFSNFNISVIVTDEFMKAVENNQVFYLHSPNSDFPLEQVDALDLWNEIIEHAHKTGDPGLIFIDEVNRKHPLEEEVKCCNACGEQTLLHGESCVLGSINLMAYLREDKMDNTYMKENISYPTEWNFDWDKLGEDIPTMVRFLDDVIDASPYPLQGVEKATKASRKIGLGIMGWADCLIKMKIPYGSQISLDLAEELMDFIYEKANMTSIKLGEEKGFFPLSDNYPIEGKPDQYRRNATLLTVAPTGCERRDTLVVSNEGILRLDEIGDINGDKWQDISLKVLQENTIAGATKFYVNGFSTTKKISCHSGLELECTHNHQYRVITETGEYLWKRADELDIGDMLAVRIGGYTVETEPSLDTDISSFTNQKSVTLPSLMSPELAKFIGIYYGNGSTHSKGIRIHFGHHLTEKISYTVSLVKDLFGIEPQVRKEHTCTSIYINSTKIKRWLTKNGLLKAKAPDNAIPRIIRISSAFSLQSFIDGYYLADGSSNGHVNYIDTSSWRMAQDLLVCLRALGQNARIKTYNSIKGRISTKPSYRIYYVQTGSIGSNGYKVSSSLKRQLELGRKIGEEIFVDVIESIADSSCFTYDIEVPGMHTYLANNVVSHNTLSRIAGVSSGIEPIFAWKIHHKLADREYDEEHWSVKDWEEHPTVRYPNWLKTANEIAPELHLRMQAAFQRHVDSSISKTINLANNATIADVENIYYNAWKLNLKGITIYRDGSKEYQPLNKIEKESKKDFLDLSSIGDTHMFSEENKVEMEDHSTDNISKKELKKRGPVAVGVTHKVDTGRGKIYITINYSEYHSTPVEVFIRLGHLSTPTESALAEWSGRLISLLLKYNVPLENIVKQGNKVYGDTVFWYNNQSFCSFPKLISHLLNFTFEEAMNMAEMDFESMMENGYEYYEEKDEDFLINTKEEQFYSYCYNCGTWSMVAEGGCKVCQNCGFEQCG